MRGKSEKRKYIAIVRNKEQERFWKVVHGHNTFIENFIKNVKQLSETNDQGNLRNLQSLRSFFIKQQLIAINSFSRIMCKQQLSRNYTNDD